ncbi:MBL fold metallo-hydrolase [Geomonas subterranea]|uniref:MBL fold metallo-hydrolase n=2 Tax=Geomonas subterranea TaxID=2847989 RepID=A0ABX8LMC7_9BACT|nr:MBL fold metallo-hydrolase [Geomonas subterranea]QXM09257.1 MBL fold metallo-hydrolase [Geomonas subterranea]
MRQPEVHLLQQGSLLRREDGNILDAHSSICLIRSGQGLIVVDTGAPEDALAVTEALWRLHLAPVDIDIVVNTHGHWDHVGCNHLFPRAVFMAHLLEPEIGSRIPVSAGSCLVRSAFTIGPGIELHPTPGHSCGSLSVVVKDAISSFGGSGADVVIAGDALPLAANYEKRVPPSIHWDRDHCVESINQIVAMAEWVVPGHDAPFRVRRTGYGEKKSDEGK